MGRLFFLAMTLLAVMPSPRSPQRPLTSRAICQAAPSLTPSSWRAAHWASSAPAASAPDSAAQPARASGLAIDHVHVRRFCHHHLVLELQVHILALAKQQASLVKRADGPQNALRGSPALREAHYGRAPQGVQAVAGVDGLRRPPDPPDAGPVHGLSPPNLHFAMNQGEVMNQLHTGGGWQGLPKVSAQGLAGRPAPPLPGSATVGPPSLRTGHAGQPSPGDSAAGYRGSRRARQRHPAVLAQLPADIRRIWQSWQPQFNGSSGAPQSARKGLLLPG